MNHVSISISFPHLKPARLRTGPNIGRSKTPKSAMKPSNFKMQMHPKTPWDEKRQQKLVGRFNPFENITQMGSFPQVGM